MANVDAEPSLRSGIADDSVVSVPVPVEEASTQTTNGRWTTDTLLLIKQALSNASSQFVQKVETLVTYGLKISETIYTNDNDSLVTVLSEKDQNSSTLQTEPETTIIDDQNNNTENISRNSISISDNNTKINNIIDNKISNNNIDCDNNNISPNNSVVIGNNDLTTSSSSSSSSPSSLSPPSMETTKPYVNEGLELWNKRRELWTRGNHDPSSPQSTLITSENRSNPALVNITPHNYNSIYDSLVYEKKKLAKPVPLSYVIKILVSGWKRDGVWPSDPPSASSSNTNGTSLH